MDGLKGNEKNAIYINQPGLFALIMQSKMKTAEKFKRWVLSEVLPQICAKGYYILLNMDRLFAVLSITYIALYYKWGQYMVPIVLGLFLNGISELFGRAGYINIFFVTHLAWHLLAYYTGYIIVMT